MFRRAVYGLTPELPAFRGLSPAEIGGRLQEMGADSVFLKVLSAEWVAGLRVAGLRVYVSQAVFHASQAVWEEFPDSRPVTAAGELAPVQDWYHPGLPTHAEWRVRRLQEIESLLRTLPVDGVWLDFIRWPARWEGKNPQLYDSSFDPVTLAQFVQETGVRLPKTAVSPQTAANWILTHALDSWIDWRCHQITQFVTSVRQLITKHRPETTLGVFTVPWVGTAVDNLSIPNAQRRIVGQDLLALSRVADVISPMVYHRLCGRNVAWVGDVVREVVETAVCDVWPVIEAITPPPAYPAAEFSAVCQAVRHAKANGMIVFKLDGLLADPEKQLC